jgi:antitoxin component YwqK of YwqJK toxin-antitoxin module
MQDIDELKETRCLYYDTGVVRGEMHYQNGVLHGPSTFFSEKGTVLSKTWYVQGKKVGEVCTFYLSGARASLQRYKEGILDGLQEYWYEDQTPKSLIPYVQGQVHGEVRLFWPSGRLKRRCVYEKGLKTHDELFDE